MIHQTLTLMDYVIISIGFILVGIMFYVVYRINKSKEMEILQIKEQAIKVATNKLKPDKKTKKKIDHEPDTEVQYYHALKTRKSKRTIRYWRDLMLDRRHPDKTMLINMEMVNGFHRTFIIKNKENRFKYGGRIYLIDNDLKYYNLDSKLYQLDYHENLTIPVKRSIPVEQIRKSIQSSSIVPVQATNPALIEKFTQSKILESLMKGGQFMDSLRKFSFYLIILLSISAIHLLLFVYGSGMLDNLKIPGFG
ncbi:hypothetical protein LCGC14_1351230 [marine sediment metagenome]|uniref:Uncharacterized protein n=1 Tax=marine sediment metagenome TaxID=412755 RepID=A0A0F9KAW3_9ZZZZ